MLDDNSMGLDIWLFCVFVLKSGLAQSESSVTGCSGTWCPILLAYFRQIIRGDFRYLFTYPKLFMIKC